MGINAAGAGGLLGGIIQGLEMGKQRSLDLQHKKDLLKLEQDKLKILENEQRLKGEQGPSIRDMFMETPTGVFGKQGSGYGIVPGTAPTGKGSLKDRLIETSWGVYDPQEDGSLKLVAGKPEDEPREFKIANRLVEESKKEGVGLPMSKAIQIVLQGSGTDFEEKLRLALAPWSVLGKDIEPIITRMLEAMEKEIPKKGAGGTTTDKFEGYDKYKPR